MKNKTNNNNNNFALAQRILRHLGRMLSAHIGKFAHTHTHTHEDIPKYRYIFIIYIYTIYAICIFGYTYLKSPAKLNIQQHNAIANWHKVQSKIIFSFGCAPLRMRNFRAWRIRHRVYATYVGLAQSFVCPFMSKVVYSSSRTAIA